MTRRPSPNWLLPAMMALASSTGPSPAQQRPPERPAEAAGTPGAGSVGARAAGETVDAAGGAPPAPDQRPPGTASGSVPPLRTTPADADASTSPTGAGNAEPPAHTEAPAPPDGHEPASAPADALPAPVRESDFDFAACRLELARLGTAYSVDQPVPGEQPGCGIERPITVSAILPGVSLQGGAQMRCDTARVLGWWMRDVVAPAAARLPGAPRPVSLALGSTYQCRATIGGSGTNLSEHATGNAIDIASFGFDDGTTIVVGEAKKGSAAEAFLLGVRWGACLPFATVLGPGSNAAHAGHLHLDIKARRGGYRVCE